MVRLSNPSRGRLFIGPVEAWVHVQKGRRSGAARAACPCGAGPHPSSRLPQRGHRGGGEFNGRLLRRSVIKHVKALIRRCAAYSVHYQGQTLTVFCIQSSAEKAWKGLSDSFVFLVSMEMILIGHGASRKMKTCMVMKMRKVVFESWSDGQTMCSCLKQWVSLWYKKTMEMQYVLVQKRLFLPQLKYFVNFFVYKRATFSFFFSFFVLLSPFQRSVETNKPAANRTTWCNQLSERVSTKQKVTSWWRTNTRPHALMGNVVQWNAAFYKVSNRSCWWIHELITDVCAFSMTDRSKAGVCCPVVCCPITAGLWRHGFMWLEDLHWSQIRSPLLPLTVCVAH